jgi:hypothetical protein
MARSQIKACTSKRRFKSDDEAKSASKGFAVYHCPLCSGYHLTSKGGTLEKAEEAIVLPKPTFDGSVLARVRWIKRKDN